MPAKGAAIQHEHRKTLGRCIDRRGETRRPGADDGHVIDFCGIDWSDETDAAGKVRLTRIA